MNDQSLPVAVIGAGPVGLAAAAHLIQRGEQPLVLEAGAAVGASILEWGHVRLFSPWRYVVDGVAREMLEATGWQMPDETAHPTGRELVEAYLAPLAALPELAPHLRLNQRVVAVSRRGVDRMKTAGRERAPFVLRVEHPDGREEELLARAVIDASGTYRQPNPLGASGLPALGERRHAARLFYGIPEVLGAHRDRYAGRRVLVAGSGHSAFNALLDLAALAREAPGTDIMWAVRRDAIGQLYGGGEQDQLEARGALGSRLQALVEKGSIRMFRGVRILALEESADGLVVVGEDGPLPAVDEIIVTTGFRPDLSLLGELRLALDPAVESPAALAPLIDPNVHSCGSVPPHGAPELAHPEADFFIVGMKSYGRAPTFLLLTGYEQVRSVVCALVGDEEGARSVELVLPETGVCSTNGAAGDGCCGPAVSATEAAGVSSCCGAAVVSFEELDALPVLAGSACCG